MEYPIAITSIAEVREALATHQATADRLHELTHKKHASKKASRETRDEAIALKQMAETMSKAVAAALEQRLDDLDLRELFFEVSRFQERVEKTVGKLQES